MSQKIVDVSFKDIIIETEDAVLFDIDGEEVWLPKSQIEYDETTKNIQMPEWLQREKDL